MKQHNVGSITNGGHKRRYKLKKKKPAPAFAKQAPYDSRSPYESPAPYASPARDSSPDFGAMVTSGNFLSADVAEPVMARRPRLLNQSNAQTTREESPLLELTTTPSTSRSRGRPRKFPRPNDEKSKDKSSPIEGFSEVDVSSMLSESNSGSRGRGRPRKTPKEEPMAFADFSEVDVSSMLKKKHLSVVDDDSVSQSALSAMRSRSRSSSVELVQEFDIFGSVLPDDGLGLHRPKTGFGSGNMFACTSGGCEQKFHLKANLKKHLRQAHSFT